MTVTSVLRDSEWPPWTSQTSKGPHQQGGATPCLPPLRCVVGTPRSICVAGGSGQLNSQASIVFIASSTPMSYVVSMSSTPLPPPALFKSAAASALIVAPVPTQLLSCCDDGYVVPTGVSVTFTKRGTDTEYLYQSCSAAASMLAIAAAVGVGLGTVPNVLVTPAVRPPTSYALTELLLGS